MYNHGFNKIFFILFCFKAWSTQNPSAVPFSKSYNVPYTHNTYAHGPITPNPFTQFPSAPPQSIDNSNMYSNINSEKPPKYDSLINQPTVIDLGSDTLPVLPASSKF
jgi:hypothetical protein